MDQILDKSKSIKNIALLVKIGAVFIILPNLFSTLFFILDSSLQDIISGLDENNNPLGAIFKYIPFLGTFMILMGILFFIGGTHLAHCKKWASILLQSISTILIILIFLVSSFLIDSIPPSFLEEENAQITIRIFSYANAFCWSMPLLFLISYLRKKEINICLV